MSRFRTGMRATLVGVITNAILATVKLMTGIVGNSYALIADAVESMADILSSAIVWGGLAVSQKPADQDHPYGHGKAEPLAAAAISLIILAAAMGIAIHAIRELLGQHEGPAPYTLFVLVGVIAVKELLARYLHRVGKEISSGALQGDAWHQRSDAITSAAAFVGISIALVGGETYWSADELAALVASVVIAAGGVRLLIPAVNELMDRAPEGDLQIRSVEVAAAQDGVEAVEKNWLRKVGARYFFDVHIHVNPELSVMDSHQIAHNVSEAVRGAFPEVENVTVHVEPHLADQGAEGGEAQDSPQDSPQPPSGKS